MGSWLMVRFCERWRLVVWVIIQGGLMSVVAIVNLLTDRVGQRSERFGTLPRRGACFLD
jgi:hypothetical protein